MRAMRRKKNKELINQLVAKTRYSSVISCHVNFGVKSFKVFARGVDSSCINCVSPYGSFENVNISLYN